VGRLRPADRVPVPVAAGAMARSPQEA